MGEVEFYFLYKDSYGHYRLFEFSCTLHVELHLPQPFIAPVPCSPQPHMLKAQILRRSFSLWNRVPTSQIVHSAARDGHEIIHIQRVRFKKPFLTRRRLIGTAIYTAAAYGFLRWLDDEVGEGEEEDVRKARKSRRPEATEHGIPQEIDADDEDEEEEEQGEPLLFLPTGFARIKPPTYYRGSDPEWQEFVRIAPDKRRIERIKDELKDKVLYSVSQSPFWKQRLGAVNTQTGAVWFDIIFPDGPPREYERPGIEVVESDDDLTIRWTTRPVSQINYQRLNNTLVPTVVATSIYVDSKEKVGNGWLRFKKYIGWEESSHQKPKSIAQLSPTPQPSPLSTKSSSPPQNSSPSIHPPSAPSPPTTADKPTKPATPAAPAKPSTPPSTRPTQKDPQPTITTTTLGNSSGNPALDRFRASLPKPTALTLDLRTFRQSVRQNWKSISIDPPRGCFLVSGLMEVRGKKAFMTLEVAAAYDPKTGEYIMINASVRRVQDYQQYPKGGS
ncbi:hypothetical protein K469DRAFT_748925 [Zopfia rhizophila CBS 207.26]|uniref:Uncharacterized protein n=1 Tax=Zopfia rhizophila CBS 207.26 TaxID=1314779 RepID=A0A6A6E726_9PEZI|nr:hypothetical protein K469DRAFT_748925 [Zopfia rhizophila CBS 207.26]